MTTSRKRQRGILGLGTVDLIVYAAIGIAVLGAVWSVKRSVDAHYAAVWAPQVNAQATRADLEAANAQTAIRANKSLQDSIPKATVKCDAASKDVADFMALAQGQMDAARDASKRAAAALKSKDAELADLRRKAATPTPGDKAAQCAQADTALRGLARDQRAADAGMKP